MNARRPGRPLFATINVTTACNLDCRYCFLQPRSNLHMSRRDFERVVAELAEAQVFFMNISGGEPFVHPQIADFLRIAHERIRHVMVLTNGTRITAEHRSAIADILRGKGAFTLQISLDAVDSGVNRTTRGDSAPVLESVRALTEIGAHVIVAMVVTRCNVSRVLASIERLAEHTSYFHLMTVQDVRGLDGIEELYGLPREEESRLWRQAQELAARRKLFINTPLGYEGYRGCATGAACMAAFSHVVIDPTLRVRPCDRLTDVVLGDLRTSTLDQVWSSDSVSAILESPVPYCRAHRSALDRQPGVPISGARRDIPPTAAAP